ncbi:glutathione S-transferase family protein [Catenovulum agarivorans]|uniref:glutathione S-transferase family protein n=1 Tax=Catenovulum agarivorans TaxID=1172192 RepID=UPI00031462EB|nr:glutathione S-transferase N-terminal domain-containing protein [Catenovulum agarivorans]
MALELYGSNPSPYVRRIRMLLDGLDYTFHNVNVYDPEFRKIYTSITPIKKLPTLVVDDQSIFDSHVIAQYLFELKKLPTLTLGELNLISAIDAVTDSLVILFMGMRSELEVSNERLIFSLQMDRVPTCLMWLEEQAKLGAFNQLNYPTMCLIGLIDWAEFRQLYDFSDFPTLIAAKQQHDEVELVKATFPTA